MEEELGIQAAPVYIEYSRISGTDDLYIARLDWERDWWGNFRVFRWDGDGLSVLEECVEECGSVTGQSVAEVGSLVLPFLDDPVVYVIDRTHQGNGFLYLWQLVEDSGLHPLCRARIELNITGYGYFLDWSLQDCDGDGPEDLVLEGELFTYVEETDDCTTSPVRKVFLFDSDRGTFLLDRESSTGLHDWDLDDSGCS
jgi:hypothetical protein